MYPVVHSPLLSATSATHFPCFARKHLKNRIFVSYRQTDDESKDLFEHRILLCCERNFMRDCICFTSPHIAGSPTPYRGHLHPPVNQSTTYTPTRHLVLLSPLSTPPCSDRYYSLYIERVLYRIELSSRQSAETRSNCQSFNPSIAEE